MCIVSLYQVIFRTTVSAASPCLVVPSALLFMVKLKLWRVYFAKLSHGDDDDDD